MILLILIQLKYLEWISTPQPNEVAAVGETSYNRPDELTLGETSNPRPDELEKTDTYHGDLSINRKRQNKANKERVSGKKT